MRQKGCITYALYTLPPCGGQGIRKEKETLAAWQFRGACLPPELQKSVYAQISCTINGFPKIKALRKATN